MNETFNGRCYFLMTQIVFSDHDSQLAALKCSLAQAQLARSSDNREQIMFGTHTHKQTLFGPSQNTKPTNDCRHTWWKNCNEWSTVQRGGAAI